MDNEIADLFVECSRMDICGGVEFFFGLILIWVLNFVFRSRAWRIEGVDKLFFEFLFFFYLGSFVFVCLVVRFCTRFDLFRRIV